MASSPESGLFSTPNSSPDAGIPVPISTIPPKAMIQVDPKSLYGVVLQFWHPWTGEEKQIIKSAVDEFNAQNIWGIRVETFAAGGTSALFDRVTEDKDSGVLPHVLVAPTNQLAELYSKEKIPNMGSYVADTQWGLPDQEIADFTSVIWQQDMLSGTRVGIPAQRDLQVLFYNRSWAQELGFTSPPDTPAAFAAQACTASQALARDNQTTNDGTGGWIVNTDSLVMLSWMLTFGEVQIPEMDSGLYGFDTPGSRDAYIYLKKMYDEGCAWISRLSQPYDYFANRQALFYSGTLADISQQSTANARIGSTDEWQVIAYPAQDRRRKPVVLVGGLSYAMLQSNPGEQLASWLFIRWMTLPRVTANLVKSNGTLPISHSVLEELVDYRQSYPQWDEAMILVPLVQASPGPGSWRVVRSIVQDSAKQIYQAGVDLEQAGRIPAQLDELVSEVLKRRN